MSDSENETISGDHRRLLQAVGNLSKVQHIKKVARKEPSVTQNEFDLIKPRVELPKQLLPTKSPINVGDLVKNLKGRSRHLNVGKELKNVHNTGKALDKPLEKPEAERIIRSVNYEKAKKSLHRWDAVVAQFQSAESQTFPLDTETVYINTGRNHKPLQMSLKSELQTAVEEAEARLRVLKGEKYSVLVNKDEHLEKMIITKEEIKKRRQDLMYLKMRQSQKSAKLRMQNKIKSKKYHRLQKQHKVKQQLKEFEMLQKTDPEKAMEKLQSLEKNRIMERASLRHKNTGTWAKNSVVKAKYNRDVQADLSEQLALSRQLTEKKDFSEDEEDAQSGDDVADIGQSNQWNPWMKANGKNSGLGTVDGVESSYRKYWMNRNEHEKELGNYKAALAGDSKPKEEHVIQESPLERKKAKASKNKRKTKNQKSTPVVENGWIVEDVEDVKETDAEANIQSIDRLFDQAEDDFSRKLSKKELKRKIIEARKIQTNDKEKATVQEKNELKNLQDLTFKNKSKRIEIDEQLIETAKGAEPVLAPSTTDLVLSKENLSKDVIKHDDYANVKPKHLKTSLAEITNCEEDLDVDEEEERVAIDRQTIINDAFEDDDIVAEFEKEKTTGEKEALAEQLVLSMPGWGSWAGTGIVDKQKKKNLVLEFKKGDPVGDSKSKSRVRINENVNKKLRQHLVSDIPFPFTSVKDYEASIRAPIGRSFVPETAFRMLTKPAVITKRGQIISPMDESELLKPPKRPHSIVEKRILYDAKVAAQ